MIETEQARTVEVKLSAADILRLLQWRLMFPSSGDPDEDERDRELAEYLHDARR